MRRVARFDRPYFGNARDRAPMPVGRTVFLVLPPTPQEAAEGGAGVVLTPYAIDRPLTPEQHRAVEAVQAAVALPIVQISWVTETGAASPARLERDQLRARLVNCWAFGMIRGGD